ncbi:hypothetical protein UA08_07865 [Talaromyces atroroseus]|uniref:Carboxylesterase type B domain-containing protein n=1 Tax=Talaromyces atroroseus TaxID=1441469 RepID=A0A225AMC4_TALAT|nr:hypothetical protein UA08_07865 [Talaromyces atroroseus]OKL56729.1 hypothetical protein UA08_07865 [Talaromyces atroroseus]
MWFKFPILAILALSTSASSSCAAEDSTPPVVTVKNGSYAVIHSPEYKQDWFLGIRYAEANRFTRPKPLNETWVGTRNATVYPPHCVGYGNSVAYPMVEDCLFLNVIRPAKIGEDAQLPVAVWIYGGALLNGGSAEPEYNLTFIVENGIRQGSPFIGVSINYRLSAFGFLTGQQAVDEGVANIGFRDQRQALHWVQYIKEDKYRRDDGLFYAAVDAIPCLRNLPFDELDDVLNVTSLQYWPPTLDGEFIADFLTNQLNNGNFVKVPILIGTNTDESTIFWGPSGINETGIYTEADFLADVQEPFGANVNITASKTKEQLAAEISLLWPNIQAIGLPDFETWPIILTPKSTYSQDLGLQWRRGSAFWSDYVMHYARRRSNLAWSKFGVPSYSYRFDVPPNGGEPHLGVYHGTEIAFVFSNINGDGYSVNLIGNLTSHREVALDISHAWVNFFTTRDPNGKRALRVTWPAYNATEGGGVGKNIVFSAADGNHVEYDDFRAEGIKWLIDNALTVFNV